MAKTESNQEQEQEVGFDTVLTNLRGVVRRLEDGNLSLEASLKAYEEGVSLARQGHEMLDQAEKRVELLVRDERGDHGSEPLDTEPGDDGDEEV